MVLWAKVISYAFSPAVTWTLGIAIFSLFKSSSLVTGLIQFLLLTFTSLGIPLIIMKLLAINESINKPVKFIVNRKYILFFISILTGLILAWHLARFMKMQQPSIYYYFFIVGTLIILIGLLRLFLNSSGHATAITALACLISLIFKISLLWFVPLVLLVGYSRVKLNVHSIRDILEGFLLGGIITYALFYYFQRDNSCAFNFIH